MNLCSLFIGSFWLVRVHGDVCTALGEWLFTLSTCYSIVLTSVITSLHIIILWYSLCPQIPVWQNPSRQRGFWVWETLGNSRELHEVLYVIDDTICELIHSLHTPLIVNLPVMSHKPSVYTLFLLDSKLWICLKLFVFSYHSQRKKPHLAALRVWSTDDPHPQEEVCRHTLDEFEFPTRSLQYVFSSLYSSIWNVCGLR